MSTAPFFSIVTPTYNRAHYLEEMIKSVQAQTFPDYEHIIVDDGSTDNSEELIKGLAESDSRIHYTKQENQGRCTARNAGIDLSQGEYVCFLDSDDRWKPGHLQNLESAIKEHPDSGLFATGLTWFFEDEDREQNVQYGLRDQYSSDVELVIANEFAPDCVCIKREILNQQQFNVDLFINEDLELWARIAVDHPVTVVEGHTAVLRVHSGNTSQVTKDHLTPQIEVFEMQLADPKIRAQLSTPFIKKRQQGFDELRIRQLMETGPRGELVRKILQFLTKYPGDPQNRSKLVTLLYNLPGGGLLKKLVRSGR